MSSWIPSISSFVIRQTFVESILDTVLDSWDEMSTASVFHALGVYPKTGLLDVPEMITRYIIQSSETCRARKGGCGSRNWRIRVILEDDLKKGTLS